MAASTRLSVLNRPWLPFLQLAWVAAAAGIWFLAPRLGPLPVVAALIPWLVRLVLTGYAGRRTPFDLPLLVFIGTAGLSLWAAYDPAGSRAVFADLVGRRKLWGLMLAVIVFYTSAELRTELQRRWLLILMAGFGAAVALWFIATNDWDANPALWEPLTQLGQTIQSPLPSMPGHRVNPNVAGGLVAIALPAGLELAAGLSRAQASSGHRVRALAVACAVLAAIAMGFGLLLTTSRGALLGMCGALYLLAAWWLAGRLGGERQLAFFAALAAATALLALSAVAGLPFLQSALLRSESVSNRLSTFYQAAHLLRDYLFTGCGLGNFPFVHSTYVLLIHVPVIVFAHSTPLDVAVEQGIAGLAALAVIWVGAAWIGMKRLSQPDDTPTGLSAGLLSLAVLVVHGALDSTVYGSRTLLLFFAPVALIVAATDDHSFDGRPGASPGAPLPRLGSRRQRAVLAAAVLMFALLLALLWRPVAAAWYANLGAVAQTLVELRAYDYHQFGDPTLDQVRQRADLSRAIGYFDRAVALDSGQVTARTRLAQIALARGDYEAALEHALAAWDAGYQDRVTRLVVSDALVADGHPEEAAALVQGLKFARSRLEGQAFARYRRNGDQQRAAYVWRAVLALDPDDERARQAAERAEAEARRE